MRGSFGFASALSNMLNKCCVEFAVVLNFIKEY